MLKHLTEETLQAELCISPHGFRGQRPSGDGMEWKLMQTYGWDSSYLDKPAIRQLDRKFARVLGLVDSQASTLCDLARSHSLSKQQLHRGPGAFTNHNTNNTGAIFVCSFSHHFFLDKLVMFFLIIISMWGIMVVEKAECCGVSCLPIEWERICVTGCDVLLMHFLYLGLKLWLLVSQDSDGLPEGIPWSNIFSPLSIVGNVGEAWRFCEYNVWVFHTLLQSTLTLSLCNYPPGQFLSREWRLTRLSVEKHWSQIVSGT